MRLPAPTFLDRAITAIAPGYGVRRYNARIALSASGQYAGARSERQALKSWMTRAGSADSDSLGDLETLRARSRDLLRNNPIAVGARATSKSNIVGTGLMVRSQIDRELLGMTESEAEAWETRAEKLFQLWAKSKACDITRTQNFYEMQGLVFSTVFESGDALVLRRKAKVKSVLSLALDVIEADRIATPSELQTDETIRQGVRIDSDGAAESYFIANTHPGDYVIPALNQFVEIPAVGARSGEAMALHVFERLRPGQSRGVPFLAPVIETLKQLDRYTEAELMKAVVASFFTVFMKTQNDDGLAGTTAPLPGMSANEVTLGAGTVVDIGPDEDIKVAESNANINFDPFFLAVVRQIGVALSIPYELLVMHFTASYSASRAAVEMAAQFFRERRQWLVNAFCQPVWEWFVVDAVNTGLLAAPGFDDPVRRAAYLDATWIPPAKLILDPKKEWEAEKIAVDMGGKTLEEVVTEKTGGDWKKKSEQRGREHALRVALKLEPEVLDPNAAGSAGPANEGDDEDESDPENSGGQTERRNRPAPRRRPGGSEE